jgi:hypothetical protein
MGLLERIGTLDYHGLLLISGTLGLYGLLQSCGNLFLTAGGFVQFHGQCKHPIPVITELHLVAPLTLALCHHWLRDGELPDRELFRVLLYVEETLSPPCAANRF